MTQSLALPDAAKPGPVIKWPGGKWKIFDWILSNMPRHDCYVEPFFGSGAVFFNKAPSNVEVINDLDGAVVNLFRMVRNRPEDLAALIALTPWARDEYNQCRNTLSTGDELEQARRLLVAMWQAVGTRRASRDIETMAGCSGWRSRDSLHQSPLATWKKLPSRIRLASSRLLDAQIENRPALDVIGRHRDSEVLIYLDPPYHPKTRNSAKFRLYAHEMTHADHVELIRVLRDHPGPVLLSGYACELYDDCLRDWARLETKALAQNNTVRCEVLWINAVAMARVESERQQLRLAV